jgi:endonuclease/exonuclease/phosphatase (EEP) superfamily protein YafD
MAYGHGADPQGKSWNFTVAIVSKAKSLITTEPTHVSDSPKTFNIFQVSKSLTIQLA